MQLHADRVATEMRSMRVPRGEEGSARRPSTTRRKQKRSWRVVRNLSVRRGEFGLWEKLAKTIKIIMHPTAQRHSTQTELKRCRILRLYNSGLC